MHCLEAIVALNERAAKKEEQDREPFPEHPENVLPEVGGPYRSKADEESAHLLLEGLDVQVRSMAERTVFYPFDPVMEIEGVYTDFGAYETAVLGFPSAGPPGSRPVRQGARSWLGIDRSSALAQGGSIPPLPLSWSGPPISGAATGWLPSKALR